MFTEVDVDLAKASRVVLAVKETLREKRSEDSFHELWKCFDNQWKDLGMFDIEAEIMHLCFYIKKWESSISRRESLLPGKSMRLTRQRRLPPYLTEVVETTVGERQSLLTASDYRQYIYYPVLDNFIAEMDRRLLTVIVTIPISSATCESE